ncbi:unnamed protein product [Moneuplotes crassus]|uniref:thioredoxin-dependent peroxiredoxin n=1 Tax=Euplotes crassus TaxID=5936 RepID=A0AAD2D4W6_EUPCR|nr:unnamed protein product [Moneuplotes crassus]|mmetsp:Transcript_6966/g.6496  ORF Transcript_6966/g.6496 Transcript_6966/m.6496 type:complete len:218 (-) Transcript_6966:43-696(-)|eukprot:CAMPEP_0197007888 /NCGR_PEP_ID=MMETSP1380-20130617/42769_1 /TAXON_ID=5936 /ORGANISM="Euplotes crassus, Strain CT5" /LENGTH=217 /DNA_ID=CAMNT_0042428195 /DNA_START=14 /DNA_END=667 /DNA_ORIENTATION=+
MEGFPLSYIPKTAIRFPAPEFDATAYYNYEFKKIKLSDYKGKYVVLFFYPLDFSFVCPTEIIAFSDIAKTFREIDCEVLGCSIDSQFCHMEFCSKPRKKGGLGNMDIPLIADVDHQIAKDYGCLIDHGSDSGIAYRATYIIDREGILRHMSINDTPVGRNPDEILRLVQAFQFVDENGQVCPAKWKPGKKAVPPKVGDSKLQEYWEDVHAKGGEKDK